MKLQWVEYKTLRQYRTIGEALEGLRTYGTGGWRADRSVGPPDDPGANGHDWLTKDQ